MDGRFLQQEEENMTVQHWSESNQKVSGDSLHIFFNTYGDITHLLYIQVVEPMLQALIQLWNPGYRCFTLNSKDLMPIVDEYTKLLRITGIKGDQIYTKPQRGTNFIACLSELAERSVQCAIGLIKKKRRDLLFPMHVINHVPKILVETFISLNVCQELEDGALGMHPIARGLD
ncbi:hypothetical protein GQ457_08G016250 [Hibiscus cannabinus]